MPLQTITPNELQRLRESGQQPRIIDVRTPAEFAGVHAADAQLMPLDSLNPKTVREHVGSLDVPLFLICKSGGRAAKACEQLQAEGFTNVFNVEGGTAAWELAGLPVVRGNSRVISLERQVRIAAGLLVLIGIALGSVIHPAFYAICAFVGAGLVFAGITDWCGLGLMLAKMPWNRAGHRSE